MLWIEDLELVVWCVSRIFDDKIGTSTSKILHFQTFSSIDERTRLRMLFESKFTSKNNILRLLQYQQASMYLFYNPKTIINCHHTIFFECRITLSVTLNKSGVFIHSFEFVFSSTTNSSTTNSINYGQHVCKRRYS